MLDERHEPKFIALSKAVARAHSRLFPEEYGDPRTLQVIALALTELIPMYRRDPGTGLRRELTESELAVSSFTLAAMEALSVSRRRFEAALDTLQVTSLEQARVSLTLRQSPRIGR